MLVHVHQSAMSELLDRIIFFPKGINYTHVVTKSSKGGIVDWTDENCSIRLKPSLEADSISSVIGYLPLYLNHELNVRVCLNAAFAPAKEGLVQLLGMGDPESGVFVGYNGLQFGLHLRALGTRRNWEIKLQGVCTSSGTLTLTLLNLAHSVAVTAGQSAIAVMYSITRAASILDHNINGHVCCDRMFLYTSEARDWGSEVSPSIDFADTGLTGSCTKVTDGRASKEFWIYRDDFNAPTRYLMQDLDLSVLNVYQFTFSRWSNGSMNLAMLNPSTGQITALHNWNPPEHGFNTSIPYTPFVYIKNTAAQSEASTLSTSMATISSGTPQTASLTSRYSTTFSAANISVVPGTNTVVGLVTVPNLVLGKRNRMIASIEEIRVNAQTPRAARVLIHVNGVIDAQSPVNLHLPWSCLRHGQPVQPTKVTGGRQFASLYLRDNIPTQTESFTQLWLVGGTSLTVSVTGVTDPLTLSLDVDIFWKEY
jgi:hypothetical protein